MASSVESKPLYVMPAIILVAQLSHMTRPNILEAKEDTLRQYIREDECF